MWGQNLEQPWVEEAWAQGSAPPTRRMLEEADGARAPTASSASWTACPTSPTPGPPSSTSSGTAVTVEGGPPPAGGVPWTTYLAGQRLTKSIEAGFMPVAVVASLASVRVWAYCMTEYLWRAP